MQTPRAKDEDRTRLTPGCRAALIAAALVIAIMPSAYRGGAEAAHPHAFFQFWLSGEGAAHRHHGHHDHAEGHGAHHNGADSDASPPPPERTTAANANDLPKLSPTTGPGGVGSAIPLRAGGPLLMTLPAPTRRVPVWIVASPAGRTTSPEPPPPRLLDVP